MVQWVKFCSLPHRHCLWTSIHFPAAALFFFFNRSYLFLFENQIYRGETETDLPSVVSFPRRLQQLELSWLEAMSPELLPGLSCACRGSRTWATFCFLSSWAGSWISSRASGAWTAVYMSRYQRSRISLLCPWADPPALVMQLSAKVPGKAAGSGPSVVLRRQLRMTLHPQERKTTWWSSWPARFLWPFGEWASRLRSLSLSLSPVAPLFLCVTLTFK